MTKVIVDTNVLIYGRDRSSVFHQSAVEILTDDSLVLYVTTKIISEYFAVCTKLGIPEEEIWNFYAELKLNTIFLYPDSESLIHFEDLMKKYNPRGNRVYDIEIVSVMLSNGVAKLATANVKDFQDVVEIEILSVLGR